MKILTPLLAVLVLACGAQAAAASVAEESFQNALHRGAAVHPSQYSFADVCRLTVAGPALAGFPLVAASDSPIRVAATAPAAPAQFSVRAAPEGQWWLLLSGLMAAAWVARRRLEVSF